MTTRASLPAPSLGAWLRGAATLTGSRDAELEIAPLPRGTPQADRLAHALTHRLTGFDALGLDVAPLPDALAPEADNGLALLQRRTGWCAWQCAQALHTTLAHLDTPPEAPPPLGAKDLRHLETLLSLAFTWFVVPCLGRWDEELAKDAPWDAAANALVPFIASVASQRTSSDLALRLHRLYDVDMLRVLLRAAYSDTTYRAEAERALHTLLDVWPTLQSLAALRRAPHASASDSTPRRCPLFVRDNAARLCTQLLLRTDGVRAFLVGMLGAHENDMLRGDVGDELTEGDALFQRLSGVAQLLCAPPKDMPRASYYAKMVPLLLRVLDPVTPPGTTPVHGVHRRAAAFTLVRMHERHAQSVMDALSAPIHDVLTHKTGPATPADVDRALRLLSAVVTLAPPAPDWIQALCTPLVASLLALDTLWAQPPLPSVQVVAADAPSRTSLATPVRDVLHTWMRLVPEAALCTSLDAALQHALVTGAPRWIETPQGVQSAAPRPPTETPLSIEALSLDTILPTQDSEAGTEPAVPRDFARMLDLPLDPQRVARLLQAAGRTAAARALLLARMNAYRATLGTAEAGVGAANPARYSLVHLYEVLQLLEALGPALLEGDVAEALPFVELALSLRDDAGLAQAALQFLLALLERHTQLTPSTTPLLAVVAEHVERYRDASDDETRALAQEAAVVLSARAQASAAPSPAAPDARLPYLAVYQEALTHLQDPILPVRAHGLHLLTQLVSTDRRHHPVCYGDVLDPALVPAIFDLLLQAIQDDESFLYLNAVQGLAHMAVTWRTTVLTQLLAVYVGGDKTEASMARALQSAPPLSARATDARLRIGETLLQVLQHLGDAAVPDCTYMPLTQCLASQDPY